MSSVALIVILAVAIVPIVAVIALVLYLAARRRDFLKARAYGASAVLHPRMMEWMLVNPGLRWQLAGNVLVSWGTGLWTLPDVLARLEAMNGVIDRIPPFVLRDYGQPVY
ncbi:MAG: hypothetical protein QOG10_1665 [Kribbellaceae bacterium]|nr:hypothetical protein [Kribbellaceae bacterium]